METMKYTDLTPTMEPGGMCYPCSEYKGLVDCANPECGYVFCIFCNDACPECGVVIVY